MASTRPGASADDGASFNGSRTPVSSIARTPSSHSMDQSDRKHDPAKQPPAGAQSRAAKSKELRMKGMEREFKVKHLGVLGVLAWVL